MQEKKKQITNKKRKFLSEMYTEIFVGKVSPYLTFALKYLKLQKKKNGGTKEWQNIGNC